MNELSHDELKWKTETDLYNALLNARSLRNPRLNYFIEMALVEFEEAFNIQDNKSGASTS